MLITSKFKTEIHRYSCTEPSNKNIALKFNNMLRSKLEWTVAYKLKSTNPLI